jgi:DNA helicase IV
MISKYDLNFFKDDLIHNKIIIKDAINDSLEKYQQEVKKYKDMMEHYKDLKRNEKDEFILQGNIIDIPSSLDVKSYEKVKDDPYFFFCTDENELVYISSHPLKIKNGNKKIVTHTDARASHLRYKERSWDNKYEIIIKKWNLEKIRHITYEEIETGVFDVESFLKKWKDVKTQKQKNKSWIWDISRLMRMEQDEIMRAPIQGVTLITWVAGSGKTNILLHRIQYLLREHLDKFKENKILFLCYNVWLQKYIYNMIKSNFSNINIQTVDKWQKDTFTKYTKSKYIIDFDYQLSQNEIDDIETKGQEIIDNIISINDFVISNEVSRQKIWNDWTTASISIEFNLIKCIETFVNPWSVITKYHVYLWLYILSSIDINQREKHKDVIISIWSKRFNYTHSNTKFNTVIYTLDKPNYDHIFIDEVQDLLPIQIKILNWFHSNSMTIAWDETQLLSQNKSAKIDGVLWIVIHQKYHLETSHRVSQQTAIFANQVLSDMTIKNEIKKIWFHWLKPIIKLSKSVDDSYKYLLVKVEDLLFHEPKASICITIPWNKRLGELEKYLKMNWVDCYIAKGSKWDFRKNIHLTTYYQAKWLEFDYVFILWIKEFYAWSLENKNNVLYTLITRAIKRIYIPLEWELPFALGKIDKNFYELQ